MHRRAKRLMLGLGVAGCLLFAAGFAPARTVEGVVFFDDNANGVMDAGESGIADAVVSDGATVVRSGEGGTFQLSLDDEARFVFLSEPASTRAIAAWYVPVTDEAVYDFPLARADAEGPLVFVQLSDIHYAPTPEEFKLGLRDRRMQILPDPVLDMICEDVNALDADFVLLTGDIAADSKYPEPAMVDQWMGTISARLDSGLAAPVYSAVGNHDVIRDESIGKTIYERHFGPTYYSFNAQGAHCVVLDMQQLVGTSLVYTVDARQLGWLEQDLTFVDDRMPILVFCHEPTFDWADTVENRALFTLLQETGITALVNGHWHTNVVLRDEPFCEITSGAVCGAWWEGPGPDGTGFGYRVFRLDRGDLDSIWRTGGQTGVDVSSPSQAVLTWADRLQAQTWGRAETASYRWDDGTSRPLDVYWNGLWSSVSANLNVSTLSDGYHSLTVEFSLPDGLWVRDTRTYYVSNPEIPLEEIFDHADTYQGKIIAAPQLQVRAIMGSDISAFDETKTIIVSKFPYSVARNDLIGLVGMYHPTSTAPIKVYDAVFYTVFDGEDAE